MPALISPLRALPGVLPPARGHVRSSARLHAPRTGLPARLHRPPRARLDVPPSLHVPPSLQMPPSLHVPPRGREPPCLKRRRERVTCLSRLCNDFVSIDPQGPP